MSMRKKPSVVNLTPIASPTVYANFLRAAREARAATGKLTSQRRPIFPPKEAEHHRRKFAALPMWNPHLDQRLREHHGTRHGRVVERQSCPGMLHKICRLLSQMWIVRVIHQSGNL
eukprot:7340411-Prymnesium_polylepis.1